MRNNTDAVWYCMRSNAGIELMEFAGEESDKQAIEWSMNIFKNTPCGPFELVYAKESIGSIDDMVDFFNDIDDFEDSDAVVYVGYVDEHTGVFKLGTFQ